MYTNYNKHKQSRLDMTHNSIITLIPLSVSIFPLLGIYRSKMLTRNDRSC